MRVNFITTAYALLILGSGHLAGQAPSTVPMTVDHNRIVVGGAFMSAGGAWSQARLWLDTGGPELLLSERLARELGINLSGAGENVVGGRLEVDPPAGLRVGSMELSLEGVTTYVLFQPAWLFAATGSDANLPSSVLGRYQLVVDYPASLLTIGESGSLEHVGPPVPARVHPETGILQADAVLGTDTIPLALDLGASYTFISASTFDRLVQRHPGWSRSDQALGCANIWGWWPGEPNWPMVRVPEIEWGGARLPEVGVVGLGAIFGGDAELGAWYSAKTALPVEGFLGPNALEGFRIEIDFPSQTISLQETGTVHTNDTDLVGLAVRLEGDGSYRVVGIGELNGAPSVEGIQVGDRLLRVDGMEVTGLTMGDVVDALRGAPGQTRVLEVEREGVPIRVEARVQRFLPRSGGRTDSTF